MILVTGASGHLGNVLTRKLLNYGEKVRAMVLPGEKCDFLHNMGVECVEGNVCNPASLDNAMKDVQLVYHLAGVISIFPGKEDLMEKVNVEGSRNVAEAALKAGVRRMIHTSSVHALKREPHGITMDESTPLEPNNPAGVYDQTKARGTIEVLKVVDKGLDAVIVCPTGIIGPHDYAGSEMGRAIKDFTRKKLHFLVEGAFDFVDVRDVAEGLILTAQKGHTGQIYILAGENKNLVEIFQIVQEEAGVKSPHITIPKRLALFGAHIAQLLSRFSKAPPYFTTYSLQTIFDNASYSSSKAQKELGYKCGTLRESIRDMINGLPQKAN